MNKTKILILRFSSFGDIVQCLSVPSVLRHHFSNAKIHWLTKEEFKPIMEHHPAVDKVFSIKNKKSLQEFIHLFFLLRKEKYTHIYDVHNNVRSRGMIFLLLGPWQIFGWLNRIKFIRRSKLRWKRILLFYFRINLYPIPNAGQLSLLAPLKKWGIEPILPDVPQFFTGKKLNVSKDHKIITLAPSSSYFLKRWPLHYWIELINLSPKNWKFILLGGKDDTFIEMIVEGINDTNRCKSLVGKLALMESSIVVAESNLLIASDTGLMHVAEQAGVPCITFMGPAPYGYPSRLLTTVKEIKLSCRPCSKHGEKPCTNPKFLQCLYDIKPMEIISDVSKILG